MRRWLGGLAPRRRALVIVLLSVTLVALIGGAIALADRRTPAAGDRDALGTVVLVPGYGGGQGALDRLAARIGATGRRTVVLDLPGDGTGDLHEQARALQSAVARELAAGSPSVDVIGYSAGGVVVRLWLADYGGDREVRHVVTLGSPLHGAQLAAAGSAFIPGACPAACQQLAPGSALLAELDRVAPAVPWMSIWTLNDRTVVPPDSARLAGAVNVVAQSICPDAVISHGGLPTDPLVTGLVLKALGPGSIAVPAAADCATLRAAGLSR